MSTENQFLEIAEGLVKVEYVRREGVAAVRRINDHQCAGIDLEAGFSWKELPLGPKFATWKTQRNTSTASGMWVTDLRAEFLQVNPKLILLSLQLGHGTYVLRVVDAYGTTYIIGDREIGGRFLETPHDGGGYDNEVNASLFNYKIVTSWPPLQLV